jgi:hypothetical protein
MKLKNCISLLKAYCLYQYLKKQGCDVQLVRGYMVDILYNDYYTYYWVEYDGEIHDISTEVELLKYPKIDHDTIQRYRKLYKILPPIILNVYRNRDDPSDHMKMVRNNLYSASLRGELLEYLKNYVSNETYVMFQYIYKMLMA